MKLFKKTAATLFAAVLTLSLFATSCDNTPAGSSSADGSAASGDTSSAGSAGGIGTGTSTGITDGSAPAVEFELSTTNATIHGKSSTAKGGYTFSYGSSGFSVNFTGTEFWMYVPEVPTEDKDGQTVTREVGVAVLVDTEMAMEATMVNIDKSGWIKLAEGLSDGEHHIEVRKQNRGFYGIMASDWFNVTKFGTNAGAEVKAPDPLSDFIVEVYGDSISNGDAVWDNGGSGVGYTFGNYSGVIERLLDAEVRVSANTGNGLLGWVLAGGANGQLDNLFPPQKSWDKYDPWSGIDEDYSHEGANAADVVIINLGTNDRVEYNNGDMTDEAFNAEYLRFIKQIKTDCPDAIVICTLGAMGGMPEFGDNLPQIAKDANAWNNGETFCYYLELQQCGTIQGGYGHDNSHPSNLAHEIYGLQLATLINSALNLGKDLPTDIPESAYSSNKDAQDPSKSGTPIDGGLKVYGDVNVVDRMFDGDTGTGWQLQNKSDMGENCWAGVEFDTAIKCTGVDITWEDVTRPTKETGYRLEYTTDGTTWESVPDISVEYIESYEGVNYCVDEITFPEISAKGIRVVVLKHDNSGKDFASQIYEFVVTSTESNGLPEGNLMDALTGKTDNLTRVQDAVEGKNL